MPLEVGLNPYSIGRYFAGILADFMDWFRLNPYSIGRYFAGNAKKPMFQMWVLILILLEGTLLVFHN